MILIAVAAVIVLAVGGICYFTGSSSSPPEDQIVAYEKTTGSTGTAVFKIDGETILTSLVDESSPSQALSNMKVCVAKQQGISLVYAKDERGNYFPKLTFLDSTSPQINAVTVAMTPVNDESWTISQPVTIDINPDLLPEVDSVPYYGLLEFLEDEYPGVEIIVFLFNDKAQDISSSTVSIREAPSPGVIYAYLQDERESAGFGLVKKAHAVEPVTVFAVTASIIAATFDIPTSGFDLLVHLGKCVGEAQAGSPYLVSMPDLNGCSEYNVERELEEGGFGGTPIEFLDEDIIERGYVKDNNDVRAVNLVGFVVRQFPEPNTAFDCDPDQRYYRMPEKVVVWIGRFGEEPVAEELEVGTTPVYQEELEVGTTPVYTEEPEDMPDSTTTSPVPEYRNIDLDDDYTVYYVTHESSPCSDLVPVINSNEVSFRCEQAAAAWRVLYVKEIDTLGVNELRIKADIALIDHARFFIESHGVGVKYDDYVDLMVLSSDPRPTLAKECNKTLSKSDWSQCGILNTGPSVLGHCGVPKFTESKECDFEVNVAGLDRVYIVLRVADAWLADVEGILSNLQIYY